jgi:RNAse (barnase) inhibitor barstar
MKTLRFEGSLIHDEESLHRESQRLFGFPDFYGHNWDAWIDCMSYIDEPASGMTRVHVGTNDMLQVEVTKIRDLAERCPEVLRALIECTGVVNGRFITSGSATRIALTFFDEGAG